MIVAAGLSQAIITPTKDIKGNAIMNYFSSQDGTDKKLLFSTSREGFESEYACIATDVEVEPYILGASSNRGFGGYTKFFPAGPDAVCGRSGPGCTESYSPQNTPGSQQQLNCSGKSYSEYSLPKGQKNSGGEADDSTTSTGAQ